MLHIYENKHNTFGLDNTHITELRKFENYREKERENEIKIQFI